MINDYNNNIYLGLRQPVVLLKVDCQQPDGTSDEKVIELV